MRRAPRFIGWLAFACLMSVFFVSAVVAQATTYAGVTFPLGDVAFADRAVAYVEGSCVRCAFNDPEAALGPPDCGSDCCKPCGSCDPCAVSLGFRLSELDDRAYLILEFVDNRLVDQPGNDLFIYATNENPCRVEISENGSTYIQVGEVTGYPGAIDIGPYVSPLQQFRFVRLSDVPADEDSSPCPGPSIDAVGAMGIAIVQSTVTEFAGTFEFSSSGRLQLSLVGSRSSILIILDTSSSMGDAFEGSTKIDIAKSILIDLLPNIPSDASVGLRVFGGKCDTTRQVFPVEPLDRIQLEQQIATVESSGRTPLAFNLLEAREDLRGIYGGALLVVVSDGRDTCGGTPAAAAQELARSVPNLEIYVIGFDLADDPQARDELMAMADVGNGTYRAASTGAELLAALQESLQLSYSIYNEQGEEIYSGTVGDAGPDDLDVGEYRIVIRTTPNPIERTVQVLPDQTTRITIDPATGAINAVVVD